MFFSLKNVFVTPSIVSPLEIYKRVWKTKRNDKRNGLKKKNLWIKEKKHEI